MNREIDRKLFLFRDYSNKQDLEKDLKDYIKELKEKYPLADITWKFYKGNGILVLATKTDEIKVKKENTIDENDLEREEEVRIKEKGINGLGENVDRTIKEARAKGREINHSRGERERGGR